MVLRCVEGILDNLNVFGSIIDAIYEEKSFPLSRTVKFRNSSSSRFNEPLDKVGLSWKFKWFFYNIFVKLTTIHQFICVISTSSCNDVEY